MPQQRAGGRTSLLWQTCAPLLRHAYLISLPGAHGSSFSLKRAALSGATLLLPRRAQFDELTRRALDACGPLCWIPFDSAPNATAAHFCNELLGLVARTPRSVAMETASRLAAFAKDQLSTTAFEAYARAALGGLSKIQKHLSDAQLLAAGFERLNCTWAAADVRRETRQHFQWQLHEWYNLDTCTPRTDGIYLNYFPL